MQWLVELPYTSSNKCLCPGFCTGSPPTAIRIYPPRGGSEKSCGQISGKGGSNGQNLAEGGRGYSLSVPGGSIQSCRYPNCALGGSNEPVTDPLL